MTVKELRESLAQFPDDLEVIKGTSDGLSRIIRLPEKITADVWYGDGPIYEIWDAGDDLDETDVRRDFVRL